jgi:hypothetical protein
MPTTKTIEYDECIISFSNKETLKLNSDSILARTQKTLVDFFVEVATNSQNTLLAKLPKNSNDFNLSGTARLFYIRNINNDTNPVYWIKSTKSEKGDFIYGELQLGIPADEATVIYNTGAIKAIINDQDYIIHPTAFCMYFPKGKPFSIMAFEKIKHRKLSIANVFNTFLIKDISNFIGVQFSSQIKKPDLLKLLASFNVKSMSFVKKSSSKTLWEKLFIKREEKILKEIIEGKLSAQEAYKTLMEQHAYKTYDNDSVDYVSLDLTTKNGQPTKRTFKIDSDGQGSLSNYNTVTFNQVLPNTRSEIDYTSIYENLKSNLETTASLLDGN